MAENSKVEIINPPNPLKSKVTVGGPSAVDLATLERAETLIANMSDNYLKSAEEDMNRLTAVFERLKAGGNTKATLEDLFKLAHDVKGQGGSFGFNLLTAIGTELCRMIEKMGDAVGPSQLEAIRIHIDAMKLVVAQRMKGDGGKEGKTLLIGLQQMCNKLLQS